MKIEVRKTEGTTLDLLISRASNPDGRDGWDWFKRDSEGFLFDPLNECRYSPSTSWSQGGPIIDREGINLFKHNKLDKNEPDKWCGHKVVPRPNMEGSTNMTAVAIDGPTSLIAAMRCFVVSKLGDEVEVPDELLKSPK